MSLARVAASALALVVVSSVLSAPPTQALSVTALPPAEECLYDDNPAVALNRAERIMARHLQLGTHPDWILPVNPTWREQPFNGDLNWLFNYHALRWLLALLQAGRDTGDPAYAARASFLLNDWLVSNPRSSTATKQAWNDMATGFRASVMACATRDLGRPTWLLLGLKAHGTALADPNFYTWHGNHALNQVIGLVDVACVLPNSTWKTLGTSRMAALVTESVDAEGVTNEQSVGYQYYNWFHYERARRHLIACHLTVPSAFSRVTKMPEFMAYATAPDGYYVQLGDTDLQQAIDIPDTLAEFAATKGLSGPKPPALIRRYAAGFLFARSGWGETRPFDQETLITMRFGPGIALHGHMDGQSLTLTSLGRRLLVDPGKYTYTPGPWKDWFESRAAHSVVTVDGLAFDGRAKTAFGSVGKANVYYASMTNPGYAGVANRRRVVWSRITDYVIVDDVLSSAATRTYRQTWHLARGSAPTISGNRLDTHFSGANLAVVQLVGKPSSRILAGRTSPIQGWVSETYNVKLSAPVLQATIQSRAARFLTLLVPYSGTRPAISGRVVSLTSTGYVVDVTIGTHVERVTVNTSGASIVER